jgi:hypothetical protein
VNYLLTHNPVVAFLFLFGAVGCFAAAFVGVRTGVVALPLYRSLMVLLNLKTHYVRGYDSGVYWVMVGLWVAGGAWFLWYAWRAI